MEFATSCRRLAKVLSPPGEWRMLIICVIYADSGAITRGRHARRLRYKIMSGRMDLIFLVVQDSLRFLVQDSLANFTQVVLDACHSTMQCEEGMTWGSDVVNSPYKSVINLLLKFLYATADEAVAYMFYRCFFCIFFRPPQKKYQTTALGNG